jgi:hypothetical protein
VGEGILARSLDKERVRKRLLDRSLEGGTSSQTVAGVVIADCCGVRRDLSPTLSLDSISANLTVEVR